MNEPRPEYGCGDYREEMRLLGLRRRLECPDLSEQERCRLLREAEGLEHALGL